MTSLIKYTVLEPLVTGTLLYLLTRDSPDARASILQPLTYFPPAFQISLSTLVTLLKWLCTLGVLNRVNAWLAKFASTNWKINDGGKAWDWPREVAVVTGGSGGIGSEVVKKLAQRGMKVAILDLQPPPVGLKSLNNVHYYECDITSSENVKTTASRIKSELGLTTILLNNAGIGKSFTILNAPDEYLEKIFHINLISHWYTVRAFVPDMIEAKKGQVISMASMASFVNAAGMVDYCVTKAGVMSFHEGLTQEIKHRYNAPFIKTTIIHPYWTRTPLIGETMEKKLETALSPVLTPTYVADEIVKAIFSGKGQQLFLPKYMSPVAGLRAFSMWLQEIIRDSTAGITLETPKASKP